MGDSIKVPTVKGVGSAFKEMGMGALAGGVLAIATGMFGGLGWIAAPLLAGSMFKGDTGKTIAILSGVAVGMAILGGGMGSSSSSSDSGVM